KFGGHDMAAGLSLAADQFEAFTDAVLQHAQCINPEDLTPALRVSTHATLKEINLDLVKNLEEFEPFGQGNPEPLLRIEAILGQAEPIGRGHVVMRLRSEKEGSNKLISIRAIWFNGEKWLKDIESIAGRRVQVLGIPRVNRFGTSMTVELEVKDMADCRE
ncbi:MAG: hypothetical protein ACPGGL_06385, partial [Phycisphaerales bacterium]